MKTRLTERDLSRIVKRVISEQGEEVGQPTADLGKTMFEFRKKLNKLFPGIEDDSQYIATVLMGIRRDFNTNAWEVGIPDMNERLKIYERERVKRGLTQLPSGDMISLILTLK